MHMSGQYAIIGSGSVNGLSSALRQASPEPMRTYRHLVFDDNFYSNNAVAKITGEKIVFLNSL